MARGEIDDIRIGSFSRVILQKREKKKKNNGGAETRFNKIMPILTLQQIALI